MFKKLLISVLSLSAASLSFANCPVSASVTYNCSDSTQQHCNWSAPWWDGYHGDVESGSHPTQFVEVFWGPAGSEVGSTNCFYTDAHGHWVELSQNSWGGVKKPVDSNWTLGDWPMPTAMVKGLICKSSPESCTFQYG